MLESHQDELLPASAVVHSANSRPPSSLPVPVLSALEALPLMQRATVEDAEAAVGVVMAALGHAMEPDRIATVAMIVASTDWMQAELVEAARALAVDPKLRDSLRYGGTITPADFEDVRRGTETKDEDRILTTISGFALRVRRQRLYTYAEAFGLWNAAGAVGPLADSFDATCSGAMFEPVRVEGEDKPRWRLK